MIRDYVAFNWKASKQEIAKKQEKQMYYFSMEFLMGRLLTYNLMNLGIYGMVKDGLADLGIAPSSSIAKPSTRLRMRSTRLAREPMHIPHRRHHRCQYSTSPPNQGGEFQSRTLISNSRYL